MDLFSTDRQREMLALSFEPGNDGYLYYHDRWSRGIPVTAEERAAYLSIPAWRSRRAWRASIAGRETSPPRPYGPVGRRIRAAMPARMGWFGLISGIAFLLGGIEGLRSRHAASEIVWSAAFLIVGGAMALSGISFLAARFGRRAGD